jgi:hypothetical protein
LTVDGVPVGFADLLGAPRAKGPLFALPAFESSGLRRVAGRLGLALRLLSWRRAPRAAVARALSGALAGAAAVERRLGLVDDWGAAVAIRRIVAVEFPGDRTPVVVAALCEQAAGRGAEPDQWAVGPGATSRLSSRRDR